MSEARKAAVRDTQQLLKITDNRNLKVDGLLGAETRSTFNSASGDTQRVIASVVKRHGMSMQELLAPTARIQVGARRTPGTQVAAAISKWCRLHGVSEKLALTICEVESGFNPDAVSPTGASGLFQVTGSAVRDVKKNLSTMYFEPPKAAKRLDIDWNCMVGIGYIKLAARYAGKNPMSDSLSDWTDIYSTYNIGPGAYSLWKSGKFGHSSLVESWKAQSGELKQNGIEQYASNVSAKLKSVLA